MTLISAIDEVTRDWDWFAVDAQGAVGHFTTAGLRRLPTSVNSDSEGALRLIDYFEREAPKHFLFQVRTEAEFDAGGWANEAARSRYLESFARMASAGLYSYDTFTGGASTDYFLVAVPESALRINQLPPEIQALVARTKSPILFAQASHIAEADTHTW